MPIYVALGNHDNSSVAVADQQGRHFPGDGGNNARGNYEVEYARRKDLATMWRMPARYYLPREDVRTDLLRPARNPPAGVSPPTDG